MEDELERALQAERLSPGLASLPEDFYTRLSQFLSSLEREGRGDLGREELAEKRKVLLRMTEELLQLRMRKTLDSLPDGIPKNLLTCERPYFEEIAESLRKMRTSLLSQQVREQVTELLLMTDKIPKIVAEDMKFYGPFSKGDVAAIPKRTAEILVRRGLARRVEMRA
jgi:DNA replication initiation complex subunit (GINS family)